MLINILVTNQLGIKGAMMSINGPFYLTHAAVEQFARLEGIDPESDAGFDTAEDLLSERCTRASKVRDQDNGLQQWRLKQDALIYGKKQKRYRLLVSTKRLPGGTLPQVVKVLSESER
jgi:hypothetical protein